MQTETVTKFCLVMKIDERNLFIGITMSRALVKNYCDKNAEALSVVANHSFSVICLIMHGKRNVSCVVFVYFLC